MSNLSFHPEYGRAFKYQFDIQLLSLEMEIPFPCYIELSWRRKNKSISTKQKIEVNGNQKEFKFAEKLSMISTCYYDSGMLSFKDKNSILTLIIYINNAPKSGGQISLNLVSVLNPTNIKEVHSKTLSCPLDKCPIKNSSLTFTLSGSYIQEMQEQPNRSLSLNSQISSLYAKSFTDSNFSMNFGRQPPSKDNSSIKDITNNFFKLDSSGRYDGSSKKRSDSVSYYGPTQNTILESGNLESKKSLGGKSHASEVPRGGNHISQYMLPPKKDDKLREEKYRLEAENTQLKLFNQEMSSKLDQQLKEMGEMRGQLSNYSNHSSQLRSQITSLQCQLQEKQSRESELMHKIGDTTSLQNHISGLQQQLSSLREQSDKNRLDNQILKQESESVNKYCFSLESERSNLKSELDVITGKLKEKQAMGENNKQQMERLYQERNQLNKMKCEYQTRIQQYEDSMRYLNNQRSKERSISLERATSQQSLEHTVSLLNERLKTMQSSKRNDQYRIQDLQKSERGLKQSIQTLERIRGTLEEQLQEASETLRKNTQSMDTLMNTKSKQQHEIVVLVKQLQEYKNKESEIQKLKQKILRAEEEKRVGKEQEWRLSEEIRIFKEDNYKLQQENMVRFKEYESVKCEMDQLRRQLSESQSALRSQQQNRVLASQQSQQNQRIVSDLEQKMEGLRNEKSAIQKSYDELLESNIQLQITQKMQESHQSSHKLAELEELRRQIAVEKSNVSQCQEQIGVLEQQLKEKSRAFAIEAGKASMYQEENQSLKDTLIETNTHLDIEREKCEVLELNIRTIEERNQQLSGENQLMREKVEILELSLQSLKGNSKALKECQQRIGELETMEAEKTKVIEQTTSSLSQAQHRIEEMNTTLQSQSSQLQTKEKLIKQLQSKVICSDQLRKKSNENVILSSQNRNVEKKNQLLMKEICQLKLLIESLEKEKKPQQNNQSLHRIQKLESQLSKREEKISRLERENSKLEEENIQLNIKIMKELTELYKKQEGIKSQYSKSLNKVLSDSQC